ncbi:hypothetical protein [Cohnella mopanensis]|uniref:hypothetical protein n=1 Tax=Cohnella mopanensis TaxID=2911966 RepID=UPI001EF92167|nr:hypothetical protein [Cohnella mopanensis]
MKLRQLPRALTLGLLSIMILSLTGCLYPEDQTPGGQASAREAVLTVQDATERYQSQTSLLPIQNAKESVPVYEKYKVDLGKLKRMGYIAQIPAAAFENGGSYQFLIIDEETDPKVKLLDLVVFQTVNDVQKKVDEYRSSHGDRIPKGDELYPGFSVINFKELGMKAPNIQSMYSRQTLNFLVNDQGQAYVDYGIDIATAVKKAQTEPQPNEDLRKVLVDASYYVPVRSPVYHWMEGEPRAVND